jgi:hypothetical protein
VPAATTALDIAEGEAATRDPHNRLEKDGFDALEPFFRIILEGLDGLVDGEHWRVQDPPSAGCRSRRWPRSTSPADQRPFGRTTLATLRFLS